MKSVDKVVAHARRIGVKALTLYSFSLENWNRPKDEVDALMDILADYLERELQRMLREGIRFNTIGHEEDLPLFAQEIVRRVREQTADQDGMVLTLALSYGARREITDAARAVSKEVQKGILQPEEIDESDIERHLYTADLPKLDLLIRTSGELRLSNYLLWQAAYAELYFTDIKLAGIRRTRTRRRHSRLSVPGAEIRSHRGAVHDSEKLGFDPPYKRPGACGAHSRRLVFFLLDHFSLCGASARFSRRLGVPDPHQPLRVARESMGRSRGCLCIRARRVGGAAFCRRWSWRSFCFVSSSKRFRTRPFEKAFP